MFLKNCIPWRMRYFLKLQEAKGNLRFSNSIKQYSDIERYNSALYDAMEELGNSNFNNSIVCEMGPGQHLSHAFLEYQLGSNKEILLEIADFANVDNCVNLADLKLDGAYKCIRSLPKLNENDSWRVCLKKINAEYGIDGLESYKNVADNSVDYCFSFLVFEHIRKRIFLTTIHEMFRFMKVGGRCYHTIDFMDHLGGKKNNLRFSESIWEDEDHYRMDNYTNRIQCSEMKNMIEMAGFKNVKVKKNLMFKDLPIKKNKISKDLCNFSRDDLLTAVATFIFEK